MLALPGELVDTKSEHAFPRPRGKLRSATDSTLPQMLMIVSLATCKLPRASYTLVVMSRTTAAREFNFVRSAHWYYVCPPVRSTPPEKHRSGDASWELCLASKYAGGGVFGGHGRKRTSGSAR